MACDNLESSIILCLLIWQVLDLELRLVGLDSIANTLARKISLLWSTSAEWSFSYQRVFKMKQPYKWTTESYESLSILKRRHYSMLYGKWIANVMRKVWSFVDIDRSLKKRSHCNYLVDRNGNSIMGAFNFRRSLQAHLTRTVPRHRGVWTLLQQGPGNDFLIGVLTKRVLNSAPTGVTSLRGRNIKITAFQHILEDRFLSHQLFHGGAAHPSCPLAMTGIKNKLHP